MFIPGKLLLPQNYEEMSYVQLALEVAAHELTCLDGLHASDTPDFKFTWNIDNSEAINLIETVLKTIRAASNESNEEENRE